MVKPGQVLPKLLISPLFDFIVIKALFPSLGKGKGVDQYIYFKGHVS